MSLPTDNPDDGGSRQWDIIEEFQKKVAALDATKDAFLAGAVEQLKNKEHVEPLTVRSLMRKFGRSRRGRWIVEEVRAELAKYGLVTVPDFEATGYDSLVTLGLVPTSPSPSLVDKRPSASPTDRGAPQATEPGPEAAGGPLAIGVLPSARTDIVSVNPEDDITVATTKMHLHDFSQLPVLRGEREVKGLISWRSIGQAIACRRTSGTVKDFMMDVVHTVDVARPLFEVLPDVLRHEVVLVRDESKKICGIVTSSDVAVAFRTMFEPFMLLSDIEAHLRRVITRHFSLETIRSSADPSDVERVIESADDLTVGEYLRLLENPAHWAALDLDLDRVTFTKTLDRVREIRNDVMHFSTDPIEESDLNVLRTFAVTLSWIE